MSQENVAVVRDIYAAFNRAELSEMVACLTEDFVLLPPAYAVDGIAHSGHEGFIARFEGLGELWSSIQLRPAVRDAGERHVIAEVTAEVVGRGSGTPVTQQFWMLATMDRGKIARSETFASEALALEAMGQRE